MLALSLWNPWTWLIPIQAKRIETRGWAAHGSVIGQRIAIHAGKKWSKDLEEIALSEPFWFHLAKMVEPERDPAEALLSLPFGAILCTARVAACVPTILIEKDESLTTGYEVDTYQDAYGDTRVKVLRISPEEARFGDYGPDRFGWILEDVQPLARPIPYAGAQKLFPLDTMRMLQIEARALGLCAACGDALPENELGYYCDRLCEARRMR